MLKTVCISCLFLLGCNAYRDEGQSSDTRGSLPLVPAPGSPLEVGEGVGRPVLADMNADGRLDIVVSSEAPGDEGSGGGGGRIAVFLGLGDGRFEGPPIVTSTPLSQLAIAVGDVNEDGRPDVAVVSHDSFAVHLLLGEGDGALRDAGEVLARAGDRPHTHSVVLADVDGDRHLDLLTTNADHNDVSVLLGDGRGGFQHAVGSPFAAGNHPYEGMVVRDVDGDDDLDIVVPDLLGSAISVLLGDGAGSFAHAEGSPYPVLPRPGSVEVGDLDGDGRVDLVATHDDDPDLSVLLGTTAGFVPFSGSPHALEQRAWDVRIVDLDGDGRNELILGGVDTDIFIRVAGEEDVAGGFPARSIRIPAVGRGPGYLATGDLDQDGHPDVVTGNFSARDVSVLLTRPPLLAAER